MIYLPFFCFVVLLQPSIALRNVISYSKLHWTIESNCPTPLSNRQSQNLKLMLNFIRESPEFQPLTLSVVLPEFRSNLLDFLLRYVAENSIEAYTISTRGLSSKGHWKNRIRLTWTFIVRDVHSLIVTYQQQDLWRASNQYVIIFTSKKVTVSWREVFERLWREHRVYRAVILSIQDDFRCLMSYGPFERRKDFGDIRKLCLETNDIEEYKSLQKSNNNNNNNARPLKGFKNVDNVSFPDKNVEIFENFQNMNNYPVNVSVFESLFMNVSYDDQKRLRLTKLDAEVVFALEKAMKAKFLVKAMTKPDFKQQDPFDLSLRDIESENVEMVITGFFIKPYDRHSEFQFTSAVYEDRLCFLSPDSGLVSKAYMPFLPFERSLWALLMAYNIVITLLWCFMNYTDRSFRNQPADQLIIHSKNSNKANDKIYSLPNQLGTSYELSQSPITISFKTSMNPSFGQPKRHSWNLKDLPSTVSNGQTEPPEIPRCLLKFFDFLELLCYPLQTGDTPAQKILSISALFFGLIVSGLYQSYLVSSLSKPFHQPQLDTVEDVLDFGETLITKYANLKSVFQEGKLSQRIRVINSSRSTKDIVAFEKKISISRYYTMLFSSSAYYDKEGNPLLHVVDECPMNYRVSYVLQSRSPYEERVNFVLLRLREIGALTFWFQNMRHPLDVADKMRNSQSEKRTIKLTLEHYSLTFLLLLLGLMGSALAFLGEVYITGRTRSRTMEEKRLFRRRIRMDVEKMAVKDTLFHPFYDVRSRS